MSFSVLPVLFWFRPSPFLGITSRKDELLQSSRLLIKLLKTYKLKQDHGGWEGRGGAGALEKVQSITDDSLI